MKVNCECMGKKCDLLVSVTPETFNRISEENLVVISHSCEHGPESTDELVESNCGYHHSLYRERGKAS